MVNLQPGLRTTPNILPPSACMLLHSGLGGGGGIRMTMTQIHCLARKINRDNKHNPYHISYEIGRILSIDVKNFLTPNLPAGDLLFLYTRYPLGLLQFSAVFAVKKERNRCALLLYGIAADSRGMKEPGTALLRFPVFHLYRRTAFFQGVHPPDSTSLGRRGRQLFKGVAHNSGVYLR